LGSVVVLTARADGAGLTVMDNGVLAIAMALSIIITTKLEVPGVDGEPEITPVLELSIKPTGSAPALIDQV